MKESNEIVIAKDHVLGITVTKFSDHNLAFSKTSPPSILPHDPAVAMTTLITDVSAYLDLTSELKAVITEFVYQPVRPGWFNSSWLNINSLVPNTVEKISEPFEVICTGSIEQPLANALHAFKASQSAETGLYLTMHDSAPFLLLRRIVPSVKVGILDILTYAMYIKPCFPNRTIEQVVYFVMEALLTLSSTDTGVVLETVMDDEAAMTGGYYSLDYPVVKLDGVDFVSPMIVVAADSVFLTREATVHPPAHAVRIATKLSEILAPNTNSSDPLTKYSCNDNVDGIVFVDGRSDVQYSLAESVRNAPAQLFRFDSRVKTGHEDLDLMPSNSVQSGDIPSVSTADLLNLALKSLTMLGQSGGDAVFDEDMFAVNFIKHLNKLDLDAGTVFYHDDTVGIDGDVIRLKANVYSGVVLVHIGLQSIYHTNISDMDVDKTYIYGNSNNVAEVMFGSSVLPDWVSDGLVLHDIKGNYYGVAIHD